MILLISLILITPLLWVLFAPIVLRIDTKRGMYWVRWKGIASFQFSIQEDEPILSLNVWFWKKDFHPFDSLSNLGKSDSKKKPKKRKSRKKRNCRRLGLRLIRSFKVKQFDLNLDTDDYVLNSYLYPTFYLLQTKPLELGINYQGESYLQLQIENRLIRLLKAILL